MGACFTSLFTLLLVSNSPGRGKGLTIHNQLHHKKRHQASFRVVHKIPIPHPFLRLAAYLALFAGRIPCGDEVFAIPGPEMLAQVFDNKCRLGDDDGVGGSWWLDRDYGGFAEGVDLFELGRGE